MAGRAEALYKAREMSRVATPLRTLAFVLVLGGLAACGPKEKEEYVERPVEQLYNEGVDALATERYATAARAFDEVERQHPYSTWATKAQLMAAYAHYQNNKYDDAIVAVDRFIQLNPSNRDVGYAYYLKAISYYEQITDVQRDARMTELAMGALEEVVRRFPDTPFARDARLKIDLTNDHLAGKEMEVGRFYMRRGQLSGRSTASRWSSTGSRRRATCPRRCTAWSRPIRRSGSPARRRRPPRSSATTTPAPTGTRTAMAS